jgi:predicted RNA binding protein YcfA (HicA-like mRNA interferase family)
MAELYRDLVRILETNCCYLVRKGKGSHEIDSPVSNQNVSVPQSTKSRHTANDVLKKAGLPKAF